MGEKELKKNRAILPIGTVRELTMLTDRQIRYYEEQDLIKPARKNGQRRYSLNDIERILEIKDYLDAGDSIKEIRDIFHKKDMNKSANDEQKALRIALQDEFIQIARFKNKN